MRFVGLFRAALFAMGATVALAGSVTIDGVFSTGEWGASVKHFSPYLSGTVGVGTQQSVDLYWNADDPLFVYGAVVGDPSLAAAFRSPNVYVYSSTTSTRPNGTIGSYGDGDDVIIESGNDHWCIANPTGCIGGTTRSLTMTVSGTTHSGSDGLISLAYNTSTLVTEFGINRTVLGNYDLYRYGGQLFALEFNRGSDREPGALVASAPEPATWSLFAIGAGLLGLAKRYRR